MAKEKQDKKQDKKQDEKQDEKYNVPIDVDTLKQDKLGNHESVQEESNNEIQVNRNHKDGLFRMLFSDTRELLNLYNALSGRNYQDPEEIEITTLINAIYIGVKNDISFVIDGRLSMYEHQSTWNNNMPLRNLLYISNIYSGITEDSNLYSSKLVKLI